MTNYLDGSGLVGAVDVTVDTDCRGHTWEISFRTARDTEAEMTVDGSNLSPAEASVTVTTVTEGGIMFNPIPGGMLRTPETKPQVKQQ
jgi:hypothetical protein